MDEQTYRTQSTSESDATLAPRWALERSELQSEVDALVHQVLGGLLKASEDLKHRIREETTAELADGRSQLAQLQTEIDNARRDLDEARSAQQAAATEAIEQERESVLSAAREEADRIIREAQAERERMLSEIRATEDRLRGLQEQIQALLGLSSAGSASTAPAAPAPSAPPPPPAAPEPPAAPASAAPTSASPSFSPVDLADTAPEPVREAPVATYESAPVAEPEPYAPAGPRPTQLVFTNVPGYQQAAAIERSTRQLPDVSNVDVLEFERGRLVLQVDASNPAGLSSQIVANAPAAMTLIDQSSDSLSFQLD